MTFNTKKGFRKKVVLWFNAIQPQLLLFFLIFFIISVVASWLYYSDNFLPYPSSYIGREIVPLFNTTLAITGFTFFLTQILLFSFAFAYRTRAGRKARFLKNLLKLELSWTLIPAAVFIFFFLWGQALWAKIQAEPLGNALELDVMGEQFTWRVRYPGEDKVLGNADFRHINELNQMGIDFGDPHSQDDFVPVQMHVPKNKPVKLYLRTRDVIHSFFIPFFRVKMDAVPGLVTTLNFTPTTTTAEMREELKDPDFNYEIACAELCGRMHFAMKLILVVDEPEEFEEWYSKQKSWKTTHPEFIKL